MIMSCELISSIAAGNMGPVAKMNPHELRVLVSKIDDPAILRDIAGCQFEKGSRVATLENDNPKEPFIRFAPMNRGLEIWVPMLMAKIAAAELPDGPESIDFIIGAPASATPMIPTFQELNLFPDASYPQVLKVRQLTNGRPSGYLEFEISRYTNRHPDGSRSQERVLIQPDAYDGGVVLIADDVMAEGGVFVDLARIFTAELKAREIHSVVFLSKGRIQGGTEILENHPSIASVTTVLEVDRIEGKRIILADD